MKSLVAIFAVVALAGLSSCTAGDTVDEALLAANTFKVGVTGMT